MRHGATGRLEDHAIYLGVVVDRADPLKLGRVRARVPEVGGDRSLPWALPLGTGGGGSAARGIVAVPEVGATVGIAFRGGDPSQPLYWAGPWGLPNGANEVPAPAQASPDVRLWETRAWRTTFDDRAGAEVLRLEHKASGARIEIDPVAGIIRVRTAAGALVELGPAGKVALDNGAGAGASVAADGTLDLHNAVASVAVTPTGAVTVVGAAVTVTGSGVVTVDGPTVRLGALAVEGLLKDAALALLNAHVHTSAAPGSPTGPMESPPGTPAPLVPGAHSTLVARGI